MGAERRAGAPGVNKLGLLAALGRLLDGPLPPLWGRLRLVPAAGACSSSTGGAASAGSASRVASAPVARTCSKATLERLSPGGGGDWRRRQRCLFRHGGGHEVTARVVVR
jgi:hypothetical protein